MSKYIISLATISALLFSSIFAQEKTNISGRWQLLDANKAGSNIPRTLEIVQTKDTLKIIDTEKKITRTYKLDGSESKNEPYGKRPEGAFPGTYTEISKVTWKDTMLVIHTESSNGDVDGEDDTIYSLSSNGLRLTVETAATFSTGAEVKTTSLYDKTNTK